MSSPAGPPPSEDTATTDDAVAHRYDGTDRPNYGDTWVYESITGAVPGIELSPRAAVVFQFLLFEIAVLGLAVAYDLRTAVPAGTAAVAVAAAGSVFMQRIGATIRGGDLPASYRRALFGSSIEVVLGLFAYAGLITYLFVVDTGTVTLPLFGPATGEPLLETLLGSSPPAPAVFVLLLVLWDVCYRIGTAWWASVVAAWGTTRGVVRPTSASAVRVASVLTMAFALVQLALVPFVLGQPLLFALLVGHVAAVLLVSGYAYVRAGV